MDYQEDEYQCSDCGTTVESDAEVCPKCNAPLEDSPTDTEFELIPVTSNLAEIAIIESILKDNNIEYSINNNAMDSVFGLSLGHSPTLLVRKDQVDVTIQLLNNYKKETTLAPATAVRQSSLRGVEGWLIFFCMFLILTPFMELPYIILYYIDTHSNLQWYPFLETVLNIDLVISILISFYAIYAGINLWRIHPNAIRSANLFLNLYIAYTAVAFITIAAFLQISDVPFNQVTQTAFGNFLKDTIRSITFLIIWKSYLKNSERVKNTYVV